MRRQTTTILCGLFLIGHLAGAAVARAECRDVGATATAVAINPINILGPMSGDLGDAALVAVFGEPPAPNPDGFTLQQNGRATVVFTNPDDVLRVHLSTTIVPVSAENAYLSSVVTVLDGSGRFEGATGSLIATGEAELASSKQVLRFRGEICTAD